MGESPVEIAFCEPRDAMTIHLVYGAYFRLRPLNPEDPDGCRILIPAREREVVDWVSANRIAAENADFRDYLQNALNYLQTGSPMERLWARLGSP